MKWTNSALYRRNVFNFNLKLLWQRAAILCILARVTSVEKKNSIFRMENTKRWSTGYSNEQVPLRKLDRHKKKQHTATIHFNKDNWIRCFEMEKILANEIEGLDVKSLNCSTFIAIAERQLRRIFLPAENHFSYFLYWNYIPEAHIVLQR